MKTDENLDYSPPPQSAAVIIPVHNDAATLPACLESVIPVVRSEDWDLIVVDDASTDGSARIARERGARVVRLSENRGVAGARNAGAENSDAEILVFIDADIVPSPGALTSLVSTLARRPEIHAVGAYPLPDNLSSGWSSHFVGLRSTWGYQWRKGEVEREFSSIQSECGAIRKSAFAELGGFPEIYKGVGMEEFQMAHELESRGYGHLLIKAASYRHHYKTLAQRCLVLFNRTARWVPLFVRRKKFESRGAFGTPGAALSCLLTTIILAGFLAGIIHPRALWVSLSACLIQIVLEWDFFRFSASRYGWLMSFYGLFALQIINLAITIGFIRGLWWLVFRIRAEGGRG